MPKDNPTGTETPSGNSETYAHSHGSTMTAQAFTARTAASHAGFFLPHLKPQMSVLDCGCGRGSITVGLAQAVGPGKVVGIDIGETEVSVAIEHAQEVGASNAEFAQASMYEIPYPDETFDATFSHAAVEHLNDPVAALSEMKRVLKPGGVMGVRDIDLGSFIFAGHSAHWLDEYFRIYTNLWSSYGGDGLMGRRLRGLLNEVGMTGVLASASTEYFGSSESVKWMTERMARRIDDTEFVEWVIELGLSDLDSLKSIDAAWDDWSAHPDAFLATTWFEAIGWK